MNTPRIFELFHKESMNVDNYFYDNVFNRSKKLLLLTTPDMLVGTRFTVKSAEPVPASGITGLDEAHPLLDAGLPVPVIVNSIGEYFIPSNCVYPVRAIPEYNHSFGIIVSAKESKVFYPKGIIFYIFVVDSVVHRARHVQITTSGPNFLRPEYDPRGFDEYPLELFCKSLYEYIKRPDIPAHVQFPYLYKHYMTDPEYFISRACKKPTLLYLYPTHCDIEDRYRHIGISPDEYDYSQKTSA